MDKAFCVFWVVSWEIKHIVHMSCPVLSFWCCRMWNRLRQKGLLQQQQFHSSVAVGCAVKLRSLVLQFSRHMLDLVTCPVLFLFSPVGCYLVSLCTGLFQMPGHLFILSQPHSQCLSNEQQPSHSISWTGQDPFNGTLRLFLPALNTGWPLSLPMYWAFAPRGAQAKWAEKLGLDGLKHYCRGLEHWIYAGFKYGQLFVIGSQLTSRKATNGMYKKGLFNRGEVTLNALPW